MGKNSWYYIDEWFKNKRWWLRRLEFRSVSIRIWRRKWWLNLNHYFEYNGKRHGLSIRWFRIKIRWRRRIWRSIHYELSKTISQIKLPHIKFQLVRKFQYKWRKKWRHSIEFWLGLIRLKRNSLSLEMLPWIWKCFL